MDIRIVFKFNKVTGEVEEFLVDDQDQGLSEARHDEIALAFAKLFERHPSIEEVIPSPLDTENRHVEDDDDCVIEGRRRSEKQQKEPS